MKQLLVVLGFIGISSSAQADQCDTFSYDEPYLSEMQFCASSVLSASKVANYQPMNMNPYWMDYDNAAWCEGVKGDGIGEYAMLRFVPQRQVFDTLFISAGYTKSKKAFYENARPKRVLFEVSNGEHWEYTLADTLERQTITFPKYVNTNWLRVEILSVYRGSKYHDTCISSIEAAILSDGG